MHVAVSDAEGQFTDLVRRAEAGEEVVLTRHGRPALRLVAVEGVESTFRKPLGTIEERRAAITAIMEEGRRRGIGAGTSAARSQDFLYDENGLPG